MSFNDSHLICLCRVFYQLNYSDEYTMCCIYNIFIFVNTTLILWENPYDKDFSIIRQMLINTRTYQMPSDSGQALSPSRQNRFSITKTYLYNVDPLKPHFYIVKLRFTGVHIIFLILLKKHRLWVLVRTASSRRF